MPKSKPPRRHTTPINQRKFSKGVIASPLSRLTESAPISWSSWKDDHLPNMLWAAICAGNLERADCLELFRCISEIAARHLKSNKDATLGHNFLSTLDYDVFSEIFSPILLNSKAREAVSSIVNVTSLQDYEQWSRLFSGSEISSDAAPLMKGVLSCFDHQSQEATDVRWLKVLFFVMSDRVRAPLEFTKSVALYPNFGDMRMVRPSIRAFEMSVRAFEVGSEKPETVPTPNAADFWNEMVDKTPCILPERKKRTSSPTTVTRASILGTLQQVCDHFMNNITTTAVDARLDSAFGIAINMLTLSAEVSVSPSNNYATGRIILRTIVENYITLKYLGHKDDPKVWLQYRNYGSGQTALAFIKNTFSQSVPDSIDMDRLEALANEDAWHETKDIIVGNWAKLNLRTMSEEAGIKDVYDSYYDWTSGFVHGHWGAVRDSSFTICMNPLHRLHRVPAPGNPMPSVLSDCCKITNRAIDEINRLYPTLKARIDWKTDLKKTEDES